VYRGTAAQKRRLFVVYSPSYGETTLGGGNPSFWGGGLLLLNGGKAEGKKRVVSEKREPVTLNEKKPWGKSLKFQGHGAGEKRAGDCSLPSCADNGNDQKEGEGRDSKTGTNKRRTNSNTLPKKVPRGQKALINTLGGKSSAKQGNRTRPQKEKPQLFPKLKSREQMMNVRSLRRE